MVYIIVRKEDGFNSKNLNNFLSAQRLTLIFTGTFCATFLIGAFVFPDGFESLMNSASAFTLDKFGSFYLFLGLFSVCILLLVAITKTGRIKLGEGKPKYSLISWVAMLYSTGMGAGLLLRAVQEPVYYFTNSPRPTDDIESSALQYTFFHWGLTPWAFYGLFGLLVAYQIYIRNGSILVSSIVPIKYRKPISSALIDFIMVVCTLLGVVAAVGLGCRQLLEAVYYWTGGGTINYNYGILLIILVCALATISAFKGINKGIKNLSNLNIGLAITLLVFVWVVGSEGILLDTMFLAIGGYLMDFVPMSLNLAYAKVSHEFLTDWTYFYWAFWLSWAPFTGIFIARISKGRSIREFVLGTLFIPAVGTFLWFTIFGSNAFALIENGVVEVTKFESLYSALFQFFDQLPFTILTNSIASFLVFTFLITSIDSAIYVLGMFTDNGNFSPQKKIRLIWGTGIALFTIAITLVGQNELLNSVSQLLILFALPFSILFFGLVLYLLYSLYVKNSTHGKTV